MLKSVLPLKKLRRNGVYIFGVILAVGIVAVVHEMVAANTWSNHRRYHPAPGRGLSMGSASDEGAGAGCQTDAALQDSTAWRSRFVAQPWQAQYKGQANLHVFEDWCGSSIDQLRKNRHYPLYPHTRTTVPKLAVAPQWTNYGLRIFGYLHPHLDGEFVFAVSSQANSEFWLSTNDSPLDCRLMSWVGKTGAEWTAPGEYGKFASQTSSPVWLSAQRKYFFELIHKQGDMATDHVELVWKFNEEGLKFTVIDSDHISIYTNESMLLMSDVAHIPQTTPSHAAKPTNQPGKELGYQGDHQPCLQPGPDMLREDPRDTFYHMPLVSSRSLRGVLPDCSYRPSYIIKGFQLQRYQGLQFVHMTYIYPNDYTRLTHMETENGCFYHESAYSLKHFGLSRYMRLDLPQEPDDYNHHGDAEPDEDEFPQAAGGRGWHLGVANDYDGGRKAGRRLLSRGVQNGSNTAAAAAGGGAPLRVKPRADGAPGHGARDPVETPLPRATPSLRDDNGRLRRRRQQVKARNAERRDGEMGPTRPPVSRRKKTRRRAAKGGGAKRPQAPARVRVPRQSTANGTVPRNATVAAMLRPPASDPAERLDRRAEANETRVQERRPESNEAHVQERRPESNEADVQERRPESNVALQPDKDDDDAAKATDAVRDEGRAKQSLWSLDSNEVETYEDVAPTPLVFDPEVVWGQTFQVNQLDLQLLRSDWIDLNCNVSGNLLLRSGDAQAIVEDFMVKLNLKHRGRFTLVRVVNVEKRVDRAQGNRYLLELDLKDAADQRHRLSHYIYTLVRRKKTHLRKFSLQRPAPEVILCNPFGFRWNPTATVHFIVPVKNQARWVIQLISDMEEMFRVTRDPHFSLIIIDYNSTDMDVMKALKASSLPQYDYVKLSGNFQRAAGLQAGVDLITDDHSIVFLCDLHIYFPMSFLDSIRKHCVEGYMAFAPILMRLNCGATPQEPQGYWEVNGFGLLGVYKSDLVAAGGMNTREFTDRWGGEDWELLDRLLQSGLEVERIHLRNFFHYYHSRRGMWNRRTKPT